MSKRQGKEETIATYIQLKLKAKQKREIWESRDQKWNKILSKEKKQKLCRLNPDKRGFNCDDADADADVDDDDKENDDVDVD